MKRFIFFACGLALAVWLVLAVGAPAVGATLRHVGWYGILTICAFHLIATATMGLAWWNLRRAGRRRGFIWARLVRDGGSEVLPLSQIGGYLLGARATVLNGTAGAAALASSVLDATCEFGAQICYIALGLVLLEWRWPHSVLAAPVALALGGAAAAGALLVAAQTCGRPIFARLAGWLPRRLRGATIAGVSDMRAELARIWSAKSQLLQSMGLHFAAWLIGSAEAWLALRLMGVAVDALTIVVFESLLSAARAIAFMVPAAIGVQEGAYFALGGMLGVPPDAALALSLLKRGRDVVLGIPALATLQYREGRSRRPGVLR